MPLYPDSPNLNPTSATMRSNGSPIRQGFSSRNLVPQAEDKIAELLEIAKQLKVQTQTVEESVRDALLEFGGLAHRSRDNAVALSYLKEKSKRTEECATNTESAVKDNLIQVKTSLEIQRESHRALSTVTDALLSSTKDVSRQLQKYDGYFKGLLNKSSNVTGQDNENVSEAMDKVARQLNQQSKSMDDILHTLRNSLSGILVQLDSNEKIYREVKDQMSKDIISSMTGIVESSASKQSKMVNDLFQRNMESLSVEFEQSKKQSNDGSKKIDLKMDKLREEFENSKAKLDIKDSLSNKSFEDYSTKLDDISARQLKSFDESLTSKLNELQKSFESKSGDKELINILATEIRNTSKIQVTLLKDQIGSMLKDQISSFGSQTGSKIESVYSEFDRLLTNKLRENMDSLKQLPNLAANFSEDVAILEDSLKQEIRESSERNSKFVTDIQADVRSLIDFQYANDITELSEKLETIAASVSQLSTRKTFEDEYKSSQANVQELLVKNKALDDQLKQLTSNSERYSSMSRVIARQESDIQRNEAKLKEMREEIDKLQNNKFSLSQELQIMEYEMLGHVSEFSKLEERVMKYEQRLNQAILDRSKGILGSTTMTIINNSSAAVTASPERSPLKATSSSRRNLSLAPDDTHENDDVSKLGKENELNVIKRGGQFTKKNRSISLFVDH